MDHDQCISPSNISTVEDTTHSDKIHQSEQLGLESLTRLLKGEISAMIVKQYCPADLCEELARRLRNHSGFGHYTNATDIGRVGMAYFETIEGAELRAEYYAKATPAISELRNLCAPFISPIDKLRLDLADTWAAGAVRESIDGKAMFVGLARIFEDGAGALPHQDVLSRDAPGNLKALELQVQLAANIYLQTSRSGGELQIWHTSLSQPEYETLQIPGSYGLDRSALKNPDLVITPEKGDLILFNSLRVHAVQAAAGSARVTLSSFIGYRGHNSALSYWS